MKLGLTKEIDWEFVGASLAREDDHAQVAFFKAFVKECNSWGTFFQVQTQLAFINGELSKEECETLGMISYQGDE